MNKKKYLILMYTFCLMQQECRALYGVSRSIQLFTATAIYGAFTLPKLHQVKQEIALDRPDAPKRVSDWVRYLLQKNNLDAGSIEVKVSSPQARYNWCALGSSLILGNKQDITHINTVLSMDHNSDATKFMDRMSGIIHHESKHLIENDLDKITYAIGTIPLCTGGAFLAATKLMPNFPAPSYKKSFVLGLAKALIDIALITRYVRTQEASADKHSFEQMESKESLENYISMYWPHKHKPTLTDRIKQWVSDPEHPHSYDRAEMGKSIMAKRFS